MAATDYDFIQQRNSLIAQAMSKVGALSLGETLSAEQLQQGVLALNALVKSWQSEALFLFTLQLGDVTALATSSFSVPTDPATIAIDKAWVVESDGTETPLEVISWREYLDIKDKATAGKPQKICVSPMPTPLAYVYPVPSDTAVDLNVLYITKLKDFETATEDGGFTSIFANALIYGLAELLSDDYSVPLAERDRLERKASEFLMKAKRYTRDRSDKEFMESAY